MNMKRIFALALMALVLCLPVWAMAEITTDYCGDLKVNNGQDVVWSYDSSSKVFTISGTGAIRDYAFYGADIWNNAEKLVIEDGITAIGEYAFASTNFAPSIGFRNMKSVSLPESLTIIGEYAFMECSSLTSVTIPGSVESIGELAFMECTSLTSVTLSDGVKSIGNWAFMGCTSLTSVTIPGSVESIDGSTFARCTSLTSVNVPCSWHTKPVCDFDDGITLDFPGEWSEWTVTEPATTTKAGTEQRECGGCGHIETREIPILPVLPQTGDDSNVILWSALACISLIGMTMLAYKRKAA